MRKNLLIIATAILFFATAANAQEADTSTIIQLNEVIVSASQIGEDAPITLQTLKAKDLTLFLGAKTYPEVMRNIGSVYATSESGSYGDAKVNIRGFKQENVTVLLNGVPLSGFRSGSMFWNNWIGLTDATYRIQVQKGIGGSMLAANSMGGTINILTKQSETVDGGSVSYRMTDYGLNSLNISLSTGLMKNDWALSFTGSRTWGSGYVDATDVSSWAYFLNLSKKINEQHSLLFTVLGSPERHGQRSQKLSAKEVDERGLKYNKNWGEYNGKINNVSENFYHKPHFSATHFFNISDKIFLSNTLYFSIGSGGGKWTESTGKKITSYLNAGGQIDWNAVVADNVNNTDFVQLPDGSSASGFSKNIQSDYLAGHTTFGLKSSLDITFNNQLKLSSGLYYQYFYSWQNERVTDLLGGNFWFEDYGKNSLAGFAGRNPIKRVGDYVRIHNGDRDHTISVYSQLDYTTERLYLFAGAMFMTNIYQHWDKYNYLENPYSERVCGVGGNVKFGARFTIAKQHYLYANGGFYSRVPFSNAYFSAGTNDITENVYNEKNYIAEAGYKFSTKKTQITINGYYSYWQNKSLLSNPYKPLEDEQVRYMIQGLDAQHFGVEIAYDQQISDWLTLSAFASVGNWQWKNNVNATIYDPYTGFSVDTIKVFTDGLYVGDAPQTQLGASATVKIWEKLDIRAECRYNDRMFANFDPAKRTNPNDNSQSYHTPSSFVCDLHINYPFKISNLYANLFFTCNNLFDTKYIERGDDGINHDLASFRGFWGIGRTVQAGLQIRF